MGMSPEEGWINCPQCNCPMPPEAKICKDCQAKTNLQKGIQWAKAKKYNEDLAHFKVICSVNSHDVKKSPILFLFWQHFCKAK